MAFVLFVIFVVFVLILGIIVLLIVSEILSISFSTSFNWEVKFVNFGLIVLLIVLTADNALL